MGPRRVVRNWALPALVVLVASLAWVLRDGLLVKHQLKRHGVGIEATVTALVEVNPVKSGPCLTAVYRFTDPHGSEQTGKAGCRHTDEQGLAPGSRLLVTYLPDDPATHRPGAFHGYSLWRELLITLAVVGSGLLLLLLAALALARLISRSDRSHEP
jgi:hypothetical protein